MQIMAWLRSSADSARIQDGDGLVGDVVCESKLLDAQKYLQFLMHEEEARKRSSGVTPPPPPFLFMHSMSQAALVHCLSQLGPKKE